MGVREIVKDKGGDRAITSRGKRGRGSLASILVDSLQDALRASLLPSLCTSVCRSAMVVVKGIEDGTMRAQGSRDIVTPSCAHPSSEATEILEGLLPLCFWPLERVKIPARKLHLGHPLFPRIPPSSMFEETRRTPRQLSGTNHTSALSIRG